MKDYAIVVDNCSNLTKEKRKPYGIEIVYMHFFIDEKMYDASPDFDVVSLKEFNDTMRNGKRITTSQATASQFEEVFERLIKEGKDILYLGCSSKLSASVKEGEVAKDNMLKKYPDAKIEVIDSYTSCYALGMLVLDAAKRRDAGMSLEDNVAKVIEDRYCYNYLASPEKLTYLKQAGRVSAPSAFFGGILGIKPIIVNSKIGENVGVEKVKGRKNAYLRICELFKEQANLKEHNLVYIGHADCLEDAKELAQVLKDNNKDLDFEIEFGAFEPCVGASVGPGTLAVNFFTKPEFRDKWEGTR